MNREDIISELENLNLSKESIFYYRDNNYFGYEYDDRYKRCIIGGGFGFNNDPNSKTIPLINLNIYYLHLHELLNPFHSDNSHSDMRPYQHNILFNKTVGEKTYSNFPLTINSKKDLQKLKSLLEQFWKNDAVPFFQYWSDLRSLLPFIETSVPSELAEILNHRLIEKKMIIWKLCSHPKYNFFIQERKEILEKAMRRNPQKKNLSEMYLAIEVMEDRLINVEPLYVWDDSLLIPKPYKGIMPKTISNSI